MRVFRGPLLIFFIGAVFAVGFGIGRISTVSPSPIEGVILQDLGKSENVDFSLFWDAWRMIREKSFEQNLDPQKMVYGAISGMVKSVGDPYTVFMPPEEAKKFEDDISGSFDGIGAEIGIRKEQLVVIAPLENTPAQHAGLRSGDKIIKIGDAPTADLTIDEAVSLIRGPRGTKVTLHIIRDDWTATKPFEIIRDVIQIPTLTLEFKEGDIAYLRLFHFNEKASNEFKKAAEKIKDQGVAGLILDLRNNPGGFLEVAQEIAGWFLDKGQVVTTEDFGGKRSNVEYRSQGRGSLKAIPTVILVNQGSASASEILAGALRDHLGTKLVGEKTFGKGSVQELEKLRDRSSLKITVAKWLTPKGILINEKGLEPDVAVELKPEDLDAGKDPQLDKALELLQKIQK